MNILQITRATLLTVILASAIEQKANSGIDTISEPDSGNWYEKLHWWKKAKPKYDAIKAGVQQLKLLEKELLNKKEPFNTQIEQFYTEAKINVKVILNTIEKMINELKAQQESEERDSTDLNEKEKAELIENVDKQKDLEQFKQNLDMLFSLVTKFKQAMDMVLPEQVKKAESYEERALDSFEQIENVLDDQKARYLYDTIENSQENIQAIVQYVQGPLRQYIEQIAFKVQQLKPILQKKLDDFEKRGVELRHYTPEELAQRELLKKQKLIEEQMKAKELAQQKGQSWWQRLLAPIASFFSSLWNSILGLFGAAKA